MWISLTTFPYFLLEAKVYDMIILFIAGFWNRGEKKKETKQLN